MNLFDTPAVDTMMTYFRPWAAVSILGWSVALAAAQQPESSPLPSADEVMARVASNQDQAEAERTKYIYVQHSKMASRHGGTVMCEETTDYRMTPSGDGSHDELLNLEGRLLSNHKYVTYHALLADTTPDQGKTDSQDPKQNNKDKNDKDKKDDDDSIRVSINDGSVDRQIVENMRSNLIHDKSKDGISARLFPLTSKDQADYSFHMVGRERMNDRDVFHISFRPKDKNDYGWSGDAFIDTIAYQPVLITTGMSRKIPFAVRTFLGTNLPGLGFTVTYAPQPDGVWFPVTFSTEFKIHVLFFFNREIILDAQNREFEKTHVTSRIVGQATEVEKQP